jgi:hypothetical protein
MIAHTEVSEPWEKDQIGEKEKTQPGSQVGNQLYGSVLI